MTLSFNYKTKVIIGTVRGNRKHTLKDLFRELGNMQYEATIEYSL